MEKQTEEIKVIFLHDVGVGTTNIISVLCGLPFSSSYLSTLSNYCLPYSVMIKGNKYLLNLWDTIGQEKLRPLTKIFIRNSEIVIFVYDITNQQTFKELDNWIVTAKEVVGDNAIFGIMGAKIDLIKNQKISDKEAIKFAQSKGMKLKYVSSKEDPKGIKDFIQELTNDYLLTKKL